MFKHPEYREPTPPKWWPLGKMELFYSQPFKIQCFIYFKYTLNQPKRIVKKYLFLVSETAYYKYDHMAKAVMNEAYKSKKIKKSY